MKRLILNLAGLCALALPLMASPAQAQTHASTGSGYGDRQTSTYEHRNTRPMRKACGCRDDAYTRDDQYDRSPTYGPEQPSGQFEGYSQVYSPGMNVWRPGLVLPRNALPYAVNYRRAHLTRPSRGYQWYQLGNQYVQAQAETGQIIAILTLP